MHVAGSASAAGTTLACLPRPDANFADEDFEFVANSSSHDDVDHATRISGSAGPLFLNSTVNFSATASKPQAARIITVRLREELAGIRFYRLDQKTFTFSVRKGFFRTPGLPARIEAKLPSACIVAALAGVANHFGYGPFTVFPLSRHNEPCMPGLRTCNGGACTFQVPGPLTVQENVVIPMKVQDAASIRCVYRYLQQGTTYGQSAFLVKLSRDGGATWEPLEYMGIAQSIPMPFKTTYHFLLTQGYGKPETRRLPYNDFGIVLYQAVTASPNPQTVQTASYGANRLGLVAGGFVFLDPGGANEEYLRVISADPENQSFQAIVTKDYAAGERIRPTIWPTPVLYEGDDLAFDILAVASPDPGADLTVVIQT